MMRKLSSERGLEIIAQGAAQYRAIFEESACPFKTGKQDVERKLWLKGFLDAKFKWEKPLADRKRRLQKPFVKPFVKFRKFTKEQSII